MAYMLAPGARLEVGPGGKMYETLGALTAGLSKLNTALQQGNLFREANLLGKAPAAIDPDTGNIVGCVTTAGNAAGLPAGVPCAPKKGSPAYVRAHAPAPEVIPTTDGGAFVNYSAQTASGPGFPPIVLIGGAAVAGLGLLYLLKKKRR